MAPLDEDIMSVQEFPVEVKDDFLERQARAAPIQAISELIWNALDANAMAVSIEFDHDSLGGISKIRVRDNGHGMSHAEAREMFCSLGGSWKRQSRHTKTRQRMLHGQDGGGRFKALASGRVVDWAVVHEDGGKISKFGVSILESDISRVRVTDEEVLSVGPSGVVAEISEIMVSPNSLGRETAVQNLAEIFATYLKNYDEVKIECDGEKIEPTRVLRERWNFEHSPYVHPDGPEVPVHLEVIEWRSVTS